MEKLVNLYKKYLKHYFTKESTSYYRIYAKEKEKALKDKTITYVEFTKMP